MAARKKKAPARTAKARRKQPARKSARKKSVRLKAPPQRAVPKELPKDEAWRALVETAVEKPDPVPARKK